MLSLLHLQFVFQSNKGGVAAMRGRRWRKGAAVLLLLGAVVWCSLPRSPGLAQQQDDEEAVDCLQGDFNISSPGVYNHLEEISCKKLTRITCSQCFILVSEFCFVCRSMALHGEVL